MMSPTISLPKMGRKFTLVKRGILVPTLLGSKLAAQFQWLHIIGKPTDAYGQQTIQISSHIRQVEFAS